MTPEEGERSDDLSATLRCLWRFATSSKLRLLAVECCRMNSDLHAIAERLLPLFSKGFANRRP